MYSVVYRLSLVLFAIVMLQSHAFAELYRLGPGDTVSIQVFQEPDLSVEAKINNDGVIDYPLIGVISLDGLSLNEAEELLDKRLRGDYLSDPQLRVTISKYRPFFISGAIGSPGSHEYRPGLTVRQAIAIAGDFTPRASHRKVYIIRYDDPEFKQEKIDLDAKIGPGDTITVKESFF